MLNHQDIAFMAEILTFWNHLNEQEKELILNNTTALQYEKGETIHNGENDCVGVILIKNGGLRTYMVSEDGREITLFRLSKADTCILSASCVLKSITFDVSIDAELDTEVLLINSQVFSRLIAQNIYVENFSNKITAERFSDVMWAMEQILFMSFDKRLAIFLSDELSRNNSDSISMTHEQIARYIGSAREVVSRMLKYFESEGLVELSRGGVRVIDKTKLRRIIQ